MLAPEKPPSVWQFVLAFWESWGALVSGLFSVPFAAFALFNLLSGRAVWAIMAGIAFFIASYIVWKKQRTRVIELEDAATPRIRLWFEPSEDFRKPVIHSDGKHSWPGISVRVCAEGIGEAVSACQAWVTRIEKETPQGFQKIAPGEAIKLPWALEPPEKEFEPATILRGVHKFIGVAVTQDRLDYFRIRSQVTSHSHPPHFGEPGTYRMRIAVAGPQAATSELWLKVLWNGRWDEIEAKECNP